MVSDRIILHSDCNCFYAAVEMLHNPELRDVPMAVGGDPEARHGIILTANYIAKRRGVKTGMALWEARQVCRDIVIVTPNYDEYIRFSRKARKIYGDYTDLVEPYGLDESWLDITDSAHMLGTSSGMSIAREISNRIKTELGITVSVGVSWNKIFSKFGSDYKKPDAITLISRENYRDIVWRSPVSDLLYVGRRTTVKLRKYGILTIGDLAEADPEFLHSVFGKIGYVLSAFARGEDQTPVAAAGDYAPIKSVGNSTTTPRDLVTNEDVRMVIYLLSESVAARLRENHFIGDVIGISIRDNGLYSFTRQHRVKIATNISEEIAGYAWQLFLENYNWEHPIRSVGVRVSNLVPDTMPHQTDLFMSEEIREKYLKADLAVTDIRRRYGYESILRGLMYFDKALSGLDAKADDHMIHPVAYFQNGNNVLGENEK
ncbi:DNA polymerase IV [Butyrivibrio sp. VCD2006]|uniref:DNA polymerase IV n=1 Tax=Butyrivibrio sp. VCD2006 TaxID=1280664 RepID=UPI00041B7960|nr:DNA polymerase IV [Butyrivibrio sp. VCD2006]